MDPAQREHELLEGLREATSLEEGVRLLFRREDRINDALVAALVAEAGALRAAGDPDGAAEAETWAEEARGLLTRRLIFSFAPDSPESARAHLRSLRERFDDAFVAHCARVATACLGEAGEAGEAGARDADAQAWRAAEREVHLLGAIAAITGAPLHRGQARLCEGTLLLLRAQAGGSPKAAAAAAAAESALRACAEDPALPPGLRARAEGNLAALAGAGRPEEVAARQAAAQRLAEEAGDRGVLRTVRRDRAFWARRAGDLDGAAALHEANLEQSERALWREAAPLRRAEEARAAQQDIEALLALALEQGRHERALEIADQGKARAFLRDLADLGRALGPVPARLLRRREALLSRLAALAGRQGMQQGAMEAALRAQLRALGDAEAQIEGRARARALDLQCAPLRFADMPALAPADGAILACSSLPDRLVLFVLDRGGLRGLPAQVPLPREALRRAALQLQLAIHIRSDYRSFDALQRQLDERLEVFWPTEAQRFLYDHLIAPIEDRLDGVQTLWIVPHGPLGALPFQALLAPGPKQDGPGGDALGARFALGHAPSLAVMAACKRRAAAHRPRHRHPAGRAFVAGVAPPLGPACAVAEAEAVARRLGCAPAPATRAALLQAAGAADVVHLSCHSDFGSALTSFQGLQLEDGLLLPAEISAASFAGALVTLSACRSAGADLLPAPGDEMAGLVGAFLRGGAGAVLASLWPIADRAALPFMDALYAALAGSSRGVAPALRQAQDALREDPRMRHPYFWAPFCLWGAPDDD